LSGQLSGLARFVGPFLSSTASALAGLFIVTFIAIYIAIDPVTYREGTLHLVPRNRRKRVREVMQATARVLQHWFTAQMFAMAVVGVITTIGLLLLGIEGAFALGLIAAILEFVPFLGPFLAAVPAIAIALVDSPEKALAVAALYLVIQQLESTLVTPLAMKNGLELPPILTILAQGIMGMVFGLLGVLVAVPLLAAIIVPIKMLYVQDVVGDEVPVLEKESNASR
jgi:predicted PurR-regulated permease PerM